MIGMIPETYNNKDTLQEAIKYILNRLKELLESELKFYFED